MQSASSASQRRRITASPRRFPANPTVVADSAAHDGTMAVRVLIVDDDGRFRDLARRMLTTWGYQPDSEAGSVTEALQRVAESRPDVAMVDIGLPDGTGLELSTLLSGEPWRMRVVLVSSDSDATTASRATAAGAVAFIPKTELSRALLHASLGDEHE